MFSGSGKGTSIIRKKEHRRSKSADHSKEDNISIHESEGENGEKVVDNLNLDLRSTTTKKNRSRSVSRERGEHSAPNSKLDPYPVLITDVDNEENTPTPSVRIRACFLFVSFNFNVLEGKKEFLFSESWKS